MIDNLSVGKKNNINPHLTVCSLRIEQFVWLIYLLLCCMKSFVLQSPEVSLRAGLCCAKGVVTYLHGAKGNPSQGADGARCGMLLMDESGQGVYR